MVLASGGSVEGECISRNLCSKKKASENKETGLSSLERRGEADVGEKKDTQVTVAGDPGQKCGTFY